MDVGQVLIKLGLIVIGMSIVVLLIKGLSLLMSHQVLRSELRYDYFLVIFAFIVL